MAHRIFCLNKKMKKSKVTRSDWYYDCNIDVIILICSHIHGNLREVTQTLLSLRVVNKTWCKAVSNNRAWERVFESCLALNISLPPNYGEIPLFRRFVILTGNTMKMPKHIDKRASKARKFILFMLNVIMGITNDFRNVFPLYNAFFEQFNLPNSIEYRINPRDNYYRLGYLRGDKMLYIHEKQSWYILEWGRHKKPKRYPILNMEIAQVWDTFYEKLEEIQL